jgi:hypothetical protein
VTARVPAALLSAARAVRHLLDVAAGGVPLADPHGCPSGHIVRRVPRAAAERWALGGQKCHCGRPTRPIREEDPVTINVDLLRRTLEHIEQNPEQWAQHAWVSHRHRGCGTAYCFAGWATVLSGAQLAWDDDGDEHGDRVVRPGADPGDHGEHVHIASYAAQMLDLPAPVLDYDGDYDVYDVIDLPLLFEPDNTLSDLRRIVGELIAQAESEAS